MRRKGILIALVVIAMLYCGAYVALRSQHVIMHVSNADHWDPEKRTPGHFVHNRTDKAATGRILKTLYCPAMLAEQAFRNNTHQI